MVYRSLKECIVDLETTDQLVRIEQEVDPYLEAAEIHRRVHQAGGPAILYARVKGSPFPMVSNLFGTLERARYIFRDTLHRVQRLIELKIDPAHFFRQPFRYASAPRTAWHTLLKRVRSGPVLEGTTTIGQLPQLVSWPEDGGAFVTLPQVYTEDVQNPGIAHSNLGMYRIQLSGGSYVQDEEIGMHYQLHRGIGVHHRAAIEAGEPLRVNIFVGGPPAMNLAAVMPLPEGLSELRFSGALNGRRTRMITNADLPIYADADFCISGYVIPDKMLPEGPFGDHLGYYSLAHDFPVMRVTGVHHRRDAIWPFTVVGRPPQEDTIFGQLIHELTGPVIPSLIPGLKAVHAVDASGVHPLLLAIGSERYVPYQQTTQPAELLTQASAILGQGQLSLAKYLWITEDADHAGLDIHKIDQFMMHMLQRIDWTRDLHFHTCTTIDTLDYSGSGLNQGSKVVIAANGPVQRTLPSEIPADIRLPEGWSRPQVVFPGVMAVQGPSPAESGDVEDAIARSSHPAEYLGGFPLIVLVDDSPFTAASLRNFLWVTFTRSNPATDIHGFAATFRDKHWGCKGSLVIDARVKPHHAPPLVEDAEITQRVDRLAAVGGPLHGLSS
ncbi:MAG: UbiD family decarboxylase [Planctomycetota bacterium]|nr:UbiD family decarboxylase [Planctomycetota bacterium]